MSALGRRFFRRVVCWANIPLDTIIYIYIYYVCVHVHCRRIKCESIKISIVAMEQGWRFDE